MSVNSSTRWEDASAQARSQIVRRVCERLEARYGRPDHGNPSDSVDDLAYIMLSNKTTPSTSRRMYDQLKSRFPAWESALDVPVRTMRRIMEPGGLADVKSKQLRGALRKIRKDWGVCSLTAVAELSVEDAEAYLVSLPGVSLKVAKCVLMYTMNAPVLPVDSHVHRIATRLGWTSRKRGDQCHEELEAVVPPHRRYAFHVDCIAHGRLLCRPREPLCRECCIRKHCRYSGSIR